MWTSLVDQLELVDGSMRLHMDMTCMYILRNSFGGEGWREEWRGGLLVHVRTMSMMSTDVMMM